jgi:hypothetical protein
MKQKDIIYLFFILTLVFGVGQRALAETHTGSFLIDDETAKKGYTLQYEGLKLAFPPSALTHGTEVVLQKTITEGTAPVYSFFLSNPESWSGKPFPIGIVFDNGSIWKKQLKFRKTHSLEAVKAADESQVEPSRNLTNEENNANEDWEELPSYTDYEKGIVWAKAGSFRGEVQITENHGIMEVGVASWYKYKDCDCAASPDFKKGTKVKVTNLKNGKSIVLRINDWGPERDKFPDRVIDLDVTAFKKLANKRGGLIHVRVEKL